MNVIYPGDLKKKSCKPESFKCHICGCLWEADQNEYSESWILNQLFRSCNCPTCGHIIYTPAFEENLA